MQGMRPSVLWIDDDLHVLMLLQKSFTRAGIMMEGCPLGHRGFQRVCRGFFDAIGIDLVLPDVEGSALVAEIRNSGFDTPICVLTGYFTDAERVECAWRAGASACLPKPVAAADLVETVAGLALGREAGGGVVHRLHADALLALLYGHRRHDSESPASSSTPSAELVLLRLAQTAVRRSTTIPLFGGCGAGFMKAVQGARVPEVARAVAARLPPCTEPEAVDSVLGALILAFEKATAAHPARPEADLAHEFGLSPSRLGQRLIEATGLDYRTWTRLAARGTSGHFHAQIGTASAS